MSSNPNRPNTNEMQSIAERYLTHLVAPYQDSEGKKRQPASSRYAGALRKIHLGHKSRYDISACLAGTQYGFTGNVWFWSDTHFFHKSVIAYCDRPFADTDVMHQKMMENCLNCVTAEDILIFGGDISMGNVDQVNDLLRAIPAYKINVLGNHDVKRNGARLRLAVDEIVACLDLQVGQQSIVVTHYPLPEHLLDDGQLNLHGHIHNNGLPSELGNGSRHMNMSVELTEFKPVSLAWLLERHSRDSFSKIALEMPSQIT